MSDTQFETALQLHRQGRLHEAQALYNDVVLRQPRHTEALHLLGNLAMHFGEFDTGIRLMARSLQILPAQPGVLVNLARAYMHTQRPEIAIGVCDRALAFAPGLSEALYQRGNASMLLGQPRAALESYDQLLLRAPGHSDGWGNRGNALQALGRVAEAVISYDRALALRPHCAATCNNRGNALRTLGRFEDAVASYDRALQRNPSLSDAHNGRGLALHKLLRLEEALAAFAQALALRPGSVDAWNNHGNALRDLQRPEAALRSYEHALALDPDCAEALSNRGNALLDLQRLVEALGCYDGALRLLPNMPDVLANRASVLQELRQHEAAVSCLVQLLHIDPEYDYAAGNLLQSKLHQCAWKQFDAEVTTVKERIAAGRRAIHPFSMLAVSSTAAEQLRAAELHAASIRKPSVVPPPTATTQHKIRLAYVSADLREHAVSYLMAGVFEHHDRTQFETTAIALVPPEDSDMGRRVHAAFDRFVDVSRYSDREIAALMRELQIDIAVDLMGYTNKARPAIFAHRPAPVQVNYLGYPGTMGASFMDYILADSFVIPPQMAPHYIERVEYLPECYQANDDRCQVGARPSRGEVGLPERGLVLCSFNNSYKITPLIFDIWMRVLRAVDGGVLWLLGDDATVRHNLRREAAARGVDANRLVFAERQPYVQHLGRIGLADLFLDTLPYNAGTTASDALRAGVPVLTCPGESFASRMAGSLLMALGLPELIAQDLGEYERMALALAADPPRLAAVRASLVENRRKSPLFDTARFCRHLEAAYRAMHARAASSLCVT